MPVLSSADIATLTGVTASQQSSWRRRGILDGLGIRQRSWRYSASEALIIFVMAKLIDCGLVMTEARKMADLLVLRGEELTKLAREGCDFLLVYPGEDAAWRVVDAVGFDAMKDFGLAGLIVDFRLIMSSVPPALIEMLAEPEAAII